MVIHTFVRTMVTVYESEAWLWSSMVFWVSIRPELVGFHYDVCPCVNRSDVFIRDPCLATWWYFVNLSDDCVNECRCVVSGGGASIVSMRRSN